MALLYMDRINNDGINRLRIESMLLPDKFNQKQNQFSLNKTVISLSPFGEWNYITASESAIILA